MFYFWHVIKLLTTFAKSSRLTAADREFRQQELRAKQQEQESQQQMMKAMMLQQQQMNTAFLSVVKKLLDK